MVGATGRRSQRVRTEQLCDPEMGRMLAEAEKTMAAYRDDDIPSETPKDATERQHE
jgi:hypothetical protein